MKFSAILAAVAVTVSGVSAAPAANDAVSMMAASPQWTIQGMARTCNKANNECDWNFKINKNNGQAATACKYVVKKSNASQANGGPAQCGGFTITSGWSGQFGPGNGFTVLSVVDNKAKQIIYPSYTDKQLAGGKVVKPDQKYAPAALPHA